MLECRTVWHPVSPVPEGLKCRCRDQSGTGIKGPSPVPECSGTGLRCRMPECRCPAMACMCYYFHIDTYMYCWHQLSEFFCSVSFHTKSTGLHNFGNKRIYVKYFYRISWYHIYNRISLAFFYVKQNISKNAVCSIMFINCYSMYNCTYYIFFTAWPQYVSLHICILVTNWEGSEASGGGEMWGGG